MQPATGKNYSSVLLKASLPALLDTRASAEGVWSWESRTYWTCVLASWPLEKSHLWGNPLFLTKVFSNRPRPPCIRSVLLIRSQQRTPINSILKQPSVQLWASSSRFVVGRWTVLPPSFSSYSSYSRRHEQQHTYGDYKCFIQTRHLSWRNKSIWF